MKNRRNTKNLALTDKELIAKYDTGKNIDFNQALKKMSKSPSPTTISKQEKKSR